MDYVKAKECTFAMVSFEESKAKTKTKKIYWKCSLCGEEFTDNKDYPHAAKKHESSTIRYTAMKGS